MGLVGILLGLALLIWLAYRGWSVRRPLGDESDVGRVGNDARNGDARVTRSLSPQLCWGD